MARRAVLLLIGLGVVVWTGRHLSTVGASWVLAWSSISHLGWRWPVLLGVVWLAGLWVHTLVLTASMPGLTHQRALTLNLSGSAVSNVLPLGGVAGTVLNLTMVRGWGHSGLEFARFVVVSKAWDLIAKLLMPLVAVVALWVGGTTPLKHVIAWLPVSVIAAVVGVLTVAALAGRATPLLRVVAFTQKLCGPALRKLKRVPERPWTDSVADLLDGTDRLVRQRWAELTWGMVGYWVLQGALLWLCLDAVGADVPMAVMLAGLVAERALTLLAITPGGAGLVETGTVAILIGLGAEPTGALAAVLLYRGFVFLAEIPVGGLATVGWLLTRRAA